jgi:sialate O-acetylesterase
MRNKKIFCCALVPFFLLALQSAVCQVRLPRLISDGMILQRDATVRIWGWASPGEKVTMRFLGRTDTATTSAEGEWTMILSPMKAGGPYAMQIDGRNHIALNNILIGEVWICSGQSNMVLPMERVRPLYEDVIARSENPSIRQFIVPQKYDFDVPQTDLGSGRWESANPWSVLHFSATGYFFARTLWEKYHVPIGLINASVGGTPIEAWMSKDALREFPAALEMGERFKDGAYVDSLRREDEHASNAWYSRVWQLDEGLNGEQPWYDVAYDASGWSSMELPSYWEDGGLRRTNGVVWFRKEFNAPASLAGKPAKLLMGRIVDADYDYINGVFVGSVSYQYPPRRYEVAAGLLKAGKNIIVVRVVNVAGRGGFIKDKPYELRIGNHVIDLTGKWKYKVGVVAGPMPPSTTIQYQPLGLFNGMIAPLLPCTIKGVIWYQGESNAGRPSGYGEMFAAMITDWREKWGEGDFPFIYVQLPNYGEAVNQPSESGWAELREAQLKSLALPNTGMAVTVDVGEWNDIHPLDKSDVGMRLALAAENVAYGDTKVVPSGPIYRSRRIEGNKVIISFTNVGSGLMAKGGGLLKRFEICGSDGEFVWANAKITGENVVVWSDNVASPTAVRYAWADNPAGANLYNREGLPASPFQTAR